MRGLLRCAGVLVLVVGVVLGAEQTRFDPKTLTQDQLFDRTRIWDAHVTFTADQWKGLDPIPGPPTTIKSPSAGEWLQGRPGQRNGYRFAQSGTDFEYVHGDLEFGGVVFRDVAARFKGSVTYNPRSVAAAKNSLKVDLNKYVKGQKIAGVSTLNFHNAMGDPSWMRESLAYRLYRDAGVPGSRTAYVRVWLTVPGLHDRRYTGLYALVENIDTNYIQARFKTNAGAIFKPVSVNLFNDLGDTWNERYQQTYDPKTDLTDAEKARFIAFCKFVTHATDADFASRIGEFVDLDAFSRYFAIVSWMANWDSILQRGQNFYMFLNPASNKLMFLPWDQDHSWGHFNGQFAPANSVIKPWPDSVRFLERMMAVAAVRQLYVARMREFSGTIFAPERFPSQLTELVTAIRPDILREPETDPFPQRPAGYTNVSMFDEYAKGLRGPLPFSAARTANVREQLAKLPQ